MLMRIKDLHLFKNSKNPKLTCCVSTFMLTFFIFLIIAAIAGITPFGEYTLCTNDGPAQYVPFLTEFREKILTGGNFFYSFNGALGFNFFGTMAYYLISPFTFLVLLFSKEDVVIAAQFIIMLKISLIACIMNYFLLSRYKIKRYIFAILFSLAYSFSYYFLGYMYNFMWLDTIAMLPLVILGLENISTRKGKIMFTLSLFAALVCNFYMGALLCIFVVLYYFFTISHKTRRDFIRDTGYAALFGLIAVGMSAIVLLPMFNILKDIGGNRTAFPDFSFFNQVTYVLGRHLPFSSVKALSYNKGDANIFATMFILSMALLFISNVTIPLKRRIGTIILAVIFMVAFSTSWGNYFMHGFYSQRGIPNRFAVFYVFLLVTSAYETFTNIKGNSKNSMLITYCFAVIALISIYVDYKYETFTTNDYLRCALIAGYALAAPALYYFLIKTNKKHAELIIGALFLIEIFSGVANLNATHITNMYDIENQYIDAVNSIEDDDFAREELLSTDITNGPTLYSLKGMSSFNSIINSKTAAMMGKLGFINGDNYYRFFGHSPVTDALLGVRYVYSKYTEVLPYTYDYLGMVNGINIYKNNYALPIAFEFDFSSLETNYANKFQNLNDITEDYGVIFEGIPITTNYETNVEVTKQDNSNFLITKEKGKDKIVFTITGVEAEEVFLYSRPDNQQHITVKLNTRIVFSDNNPGSIFYIGNVKQGDTIELNYSLSEDALNNNKYTVFLSKLNKTAFENFYSDVLSKSLQNVDVNGNIISGTYNADSDDCELVFTVPYDSGWHAFVNNEEVEVENVQNALCLIKLNKGNNEIIMKYIPKGFFCGMIITCTSAFIFALYAIISKKKERRG